MLIDLDNVTLMIERFVHLFVLNNLLDKSVLFDLDCRRIIEIINLDDTEPVLV